MKEWDTNALFDIYIYFPPSLVNLRVANMTFDKILTIHTLYVKDEYDAFHKRMYIKIWKCKMQTETTST